MKSHQQTHFPAIYTHTRNNISTLSQIVLVTLLVEIMLGFLILLVFHPLLLISFWPFLIMPPVGEIIVGGAFIFTASKRDIRKYIKTVKQKLESFSSVTVPLNVRSDMPERADISNSVSAQNTSLALHILVEQHTGSLLLLGASGSGKTTTLRNHQYTVLSTDDELTHSNGKIPIYVALSEYNTLLNKEAQKHAESMENDSVSSEIPTLIDFLCTNTIDELKPLRPYIRQLFDRGRILLLCDDLHAIASTSALYQEIIDIMNNENTVFLTCDKTFYCEQPLLETLILDDFMREVEIAPLTANQVEQFVNIYLNANLTNMSGNIQLYTPNRILSIIHALHLEEACINPSFLLLLIETLNDVVAESREMGNTRGLLLRQMVSKQLSEALSNVEYKREGVDIEEDGVRVLLCFIAALTRRKQYDDEEDEGVPGEDKLRHRKTYRELAVKLKNDLDDLSVNETSLDTEDDPSLYLPFFSNMEIAHMLEFAEKAALITISPKNFIQFKFQAFEEFFASDYLQRLDEVGKQEILPIEGELFSHVTSWFKPLQIWSSILDDPTQLENRLAHAGRSSTVYAEAALSLGIICADTRLRQRLTLALQEYVLPKALEELFKQILTSKDGVATLAKVFEQCAHEVGVRVYRFLLPLITLEQVDTLFCELDPEATAPLLFQYLPEAIGKNQFGVVPLLKSILGRLGSTIIPLASKACEPTWNLSGNAYNEHMTLRKTAIGILGRVREQRAIDVLLHYLHEDSEISKEAASALIDTGPTLALKPILEEAIGVSTHKSRELALQVIQGFLASPPTDQLQYRNTLNTLLRLLSSIYENSAHQHAKSLLIQEGLSSDENRSSLTIKAAVFCLLSPETDTHQMLNIQAVLQQIGGRTLPHLLPILKQPSEMVVLRVVQIITLIDDKDVITPLIALIAAPWQNVKELATKTLIEKYPNESVPLLVQLILSTKHSDKEAVVASQTLKAIGDTSTEYIIGHMQPVVAGRTQLLVQVLAYTQDKRSVPALLEMLAIAKKNTLLTLAADVVLALGSMPDRRSVTPLLDMLTFANADSARNTFYTLVSKTLSHFNKEELQDLIAALDSEKETSITKGVCDALCLMQPFPQQQLLSVFENGSIAHVKQIMLVFRAKGTYVAQFLVEQLSYPYERVQQFVQQTLDGMEEKQILPALLEVHHTERRSKIAYFLRKNPQTSIPYLVEFLSHDEVQRREAAVSTLIEFGAIILSALTKSLNQPKNNASQRSQYIIETLVLRDAKILSSVLSLFPLLSVPSQQYGYNALLNVLTNNLIEISTPVLIANLHSPDQQIRQGIVDALVLLIQKNNARSELLLQQIHVAFLRDEQRSAAAAVLERTAEKAVPIAAELTSHENAVIRQNACEVLSKIGGPALPTVLTFINSPAKQAMGESILHGMKTSVVFSYIIDLLGSQKPDAVENALTLLLGRVRTDADTSIRPLNREQEIIPALLEHVKTQPRNSTHLRIFAILLLLDKNSVLRALSKTLAKGPYSPLWLEWLTPLFLMLNMEGMEARNTLLKIIQIPTPSHKLTAEMVSILGMIEPNEIVENYAISLVNPTIAPLHLGMPQTTTQAELALRALGSLLVKGKWNSNTLQERRRNSVNETGEHELYTLLLGGSYRERINSLRKELSNEQSAREQAVREHQGQILAYQNEVESWKKKFNSKNNELMATRDNLERVQGELKSARDLTTSLQLRNQSLSNSIKGLKETLQQQDNRGIH